MLLQLHDSTCLEFCSRVDELADSGRAHTEGDGKALTVTQGDGVRSVFFSFDGCFEHREGVFSASVEGDGCLKTC